MYIHFEHFFLSCGHFFDEVPRYEFGRLRQNGPETAQSARKLRVLPLDHVLLWHFVTRACECDCQASLILSMTFKMVTWPWITWPNHMILRMFHYKTANWSCGIKFFLQQPLHQMLQFFLLSGLFFICFLLVPLDHHESLLNSGKLPNKAFNLNTDYLASGWLSFFILQTGYVLKFVYFLLVLIGWSNLVTISGQSSDITISRISITLVNGELIILSNIM